MYPTTTSIIPKQHCLQFMYLECNGIQIMLVCFCLLTFGICLQYYSCSNSTFDIYKCLGKKIEFLNEQFIFLDVHYTHSDNQFIKGLFIIGKSYPLGLCVNHILWSVQHCLELFCIVIETLKHNVICQR